MLSTVERVALATGNTAILKYATHPFTNEAAVLHAAASAGVPVPAVYASKRAGDWLLMLLEDLGDTTRRPTDHDGASAAAQLHQANPACPNGPIWDSRALADLPYVMLDAIADLRTSGRLEVDAGTVRALARALDKIGRRSTGAETPPFGLVHGELHPTSLHLGREGMRILDFGMAFTGPGILDLATWQGTRRPPNRRRLANQLDAYVAAGGSTHVRVQRGGLPAETWALGWHRLQSAAWLLNLTATGSSGFDRNITMQILRRQIIASVKLLG